MADHAAELMDRASQDLRAGSFAQAEQLFRQAVALAPGEPVAHYNLGVALGAQQLCEAAIECYHRALQLRPEFFEAVYNLGTALSDHGQLERAAECFRRAIGLRPGFSAAHSSLAHVQIARGCFEEALTSCRRALELSSENRDAWLQLGHSQRGLGRWDEAAAGYRAALAMRSDDPEIHNNLSGCLVQLGRLDEAAAHLREALRLRPDFPEAANNLGSVCQKQGRLDDAVISCVHALRLRPEYANAHNNLGSTRLAQGQLEAAFVCYREALRLQPDFAVAHSSLLFALGNDARATPEELLAAHCAWGDQHSKSGTPRAAYANVRNPERRLRVGYVSPDFRRHAVARFLEPLLANHDPAAVEVFGYAEVPAPDAVTQRLRSLTNSWRWTPGLTDHQLAAQIRADQIDILVDLAGHTAGHRLGAFALEPAPVQLTYLGYPDTTGLRAIQYRLTDAIADPPGATPATTEELVRLPRAAWCFGPPLEAPQVGPLPAGRNGHITFGSLHRLSRLNPAVLDLWAALLRTLPTARLLLFRNTLNGEAKESLRRQLVQRGVADRVELRDRAPDGYLAVFGDVDMALDTFPWSGHTTACEGLWMGVPIVTLRGNRAAGRMVASVLTQVGLTDWIADTPAEYLERAVAWSRELPGLTGLRAQLRERLRTHLCDGPAFAREVELVYRHLWQRWCACPHVPGKVCS